MGPMIGRPAKRCLSAPAGGEDSQRASPCAAAAAGRDEGAERLELARRLPGFRFAQPRPLSRHAPMPQRRAHPKTSAEQVCLRNKGGFRIGSKPDPHFPVDRGLVLCPVRKLLGLRCIVVRPSRPPATGETPAPQPRVIPLFPFDKALVLAVTNFSPASDAEWLRLLAHRVQSRWRVDGHRVAEHRTLAATSPSSLGRAAE